MRTRRATTIRLLSMTGKSSNLHFEPDEYLALLSPTTRHSLLDPYLGDVSSGPRLGKGWRRPARHRDKVTATISTAWSRDEIDAVDGAVPGAGNTRTQAAPSFSLSCPHDLSVRRSSTQSTAVNSELSTECALQRTSHRANETELSCQKDAKRQKTACNHNCRLSAEPEVGEYFDGNDQRDCNVLSIEKNDDWHHYLSTHAGPNSRLTAENVSLAASSGVFSPALMPKIALEESVPSRRSSCTIESTITAYSVEAQEMTETKNVPNLRRVVEKAWIKTCHKHWKKRLESRK
jgi:hypothetical protein